MDRLRFVCGMALVLGVLAGTVEDGAAATKPRWTDGSPAVREAVQKQRAFVTVVVVPLCHRDQIDCGSNLAGDPDDLEHNLYWGAVFGQRRFFTRPKSGWEQVAVREEKGDVLEEVVVKRDLPEGAFGAEGKVTAVVVLRAYDGDAIDRAVGDYYGLATRGGTVSVPELAKQPLSIQMVGYAGHNRLMDGIELPAAPPAKSRAQLPTFVFACFSEKYFADRLVEGGARPVALTRGLMAPEGYVVDAAIRSLAEERSLDEVRRSVVAAYARWQRVEEKKIGYLFTKLEE